MERNYRLWGKETLISMMLSLLRLVLKFLLLENCLKTKFSSPQNKTRVLIFWSCCHKLPQTRWLQRKCIHSLGSMTRNLKSRWPLGSTSSEETRRASFVCSSFCSGHPWHSAASLQSLTLSSHVSFSLLSLLSLILYLIRYLSLGSSLPSYSRILST